MTVLIITFGALMLLAGISFVISPKIIFDWLSENSNKLGMHIGAVVGRLVLGALLIYQSSVSKFPFVIEIIGWVSIAAAIVFAVIGRNKFKRFVSWKFSLSKPFGRVVGVSAICFGSFLIYAFV